MVDYNDHCCASNFSMKRTYPILKANLHTHTNISDGSLSPEELVNEAASQGVKILAVTDHDTAEGCARALSEAEKLRNSGSQIAVIPGIEFSCSWKLDRECGSLEDHLHVVGLFIDPESSELKNLSSHHRELRLKRPAIIQDKLERYFRSIDLSEKGINVDDLMAGLRSITGGYRKLIAEYLVKRGVYSTVSEVFDNLFKKDAPCYDECEWKDVDEIVATIREAGGISVLAHPHKIDAVKTDDDIRDLITDFLLHHGGDGVETGWPMQEIHHAETVIKACEIAAQNGVVPWCSAGSDFHDRGVALRALEHVLSIPSGLKPVWEHDKFGNVWTELGVTGNKSFVREHRIISVLD